MTRIVLMDGPANNCVYEIDCAPVHLHKVEYRIPMQVPVECPHASDDEVEVEAVYECLHDNVFIFAGVEE